jgi:hypothetical protein
MLLQPDKIIKPHHGNGLDRFLFRKPYYVGTQDSAHARYCHNRGRASDLPGLPSLAQVGQAGCPFKRSAGKTLFSG